MVMQIFHIKLSLEATKNIFINSLEEPAFRGLLRYEKRRSGITLLSTIREGGGGEEKTIIQDSNALASSAE